MDDEKDDVFFSSSSSFSAGAPLLPAILPSTAAATTTRATQAGVLFEDDAAGGRCRRARRGRFAARRPRTSHGYSLLLILLIFNFFYVFFPTRISSTLPSVPISFFPDHGIISLKAHGGEGTTKEERLPYEATVYVPPRASSPSAPLLSHNPFLFPSHASHPRRLSWRTRQVCPSSLPSASAFSPSSLSLSLSRSLFLFLIRLIFSLSLSYPLTLLLHPLARAIYFVFVPPARPAQLARYVRACSAAASTRPDTGDETLSCLRSPARTLARSQPSSSSPSSSERLRIRGNQPPSLLARVARDRRNGQAGSG